MDGLLIAGDGKQALAALTKSPPHALLLVGPSGLGKATVATAWAKQLTSPEHITIVSPDEKGTLTIDVIRGLYKQTRSRQAAHQVAIIDHAEAMGIDAQNALLKLLEEPRPGVTFILTAPTDDALLPTITSRSQSIGLQRLSQRELTALAQTKKPAIPQQELAQLLFVADGRPGTLVRLLDDPKAFEHHKELMQQAKKLLTATPYERLSSIAGIASTREDAIQVLEAMAYMIHLQLLRQPSEGLMQFADDIQQTLSRLAQNGNPRAQLTALFSAG